MNKDNKAIVPCKQKKNELTKKEKKAKESITVLDKESKPRSEAYPKTIVVTKEKHGPHQ